MTDPLSWNKTDTDDDIEHTTSDQGETSTRENPEESSESDESDDDGPHPSNAVETVDFRNVSNTTWPSFSNAPDEKPYRVRRKDNPNLSRQQKDQKYTINFVKNDGTAFFKRIAKKFGIREKQLVLYYPLVQNNQDVDWQCVEYDDDLKDSMKILYSHLPRDDLYPCVREEFPSCSTV